MAIHASMAVKESEESEMRDGEDIELVLGNIVRAMELLHGCREFVQLMPEVRVNVAYALPDARKVDQIAAVEGRITVAGGLPSAAGGPRFGASDHLARLILEVRRHDTAVRAAINFKCDAELIRTVREHSSQHNMLFGWIDRTAEPESASQNDGRSMPWIADQLVAKFGAIPRLFYEGPGWGKEPLFFVLGGDAVEVASLGIDIARQHALRMEGRRDQE